VQASEAALKTDIAGVRADLRQVETRLTAEVASVRSDMGMQDRIVIRLSGVMVVRLGVLFASLKWPSG